VKNPHAVALGLLGASKGGIARSLAISEEKRREIARAAAAARWDGSLPEILRPLFWQYRFEELRLPESMNEVMIHVLSYGGPSHISWLRRRFGDDGIAEWIKKRKGRGLTRSQMAAWIPRSTMNRWLAADSVAQIWENR
jgi:hypothetical protein